MTINDNIIKFAIFILYFIILLIESSSQIKFGFENGPTNGLYIYSNKKESNDSDTHIRRFTSFIPSPILTASFGSLHSSIKINDTPITVHLLTPVLTHGSPVLRVLFYGNNARNNGNQDEEKQCVRVDVQELGYLCVLEHWCLVSITIPWYWWPSTSNSNLRSSKTIDNIIDLSKPIRKDNFKSDKSNRNSEKFTATSKSRIKANKKELNNGAISSTFDNTSPISPAEQSSQTSLFKSSKSPNVKLTKSSQKSFSKSSTYRIDSIYNKPLTLPFTYSLDCISPINISPFPKSQIQSKPKQSSSYSLSVSLSSVDYEEIISDYRVRILLPRVPLYIHSRVWVTVVVKESLTIGCKIGIVVKGGRVVDVMKGENDWNVEVERGNGMVTIWKNNKKETGNLRDAKFNIAGIGDTIQVNEGNERIVDNEDDNDNDDDDDDDDEDDEELEVFAWLVEIDDSNITNGGRIVWSLEFLDENNNLDKKIRNESEKMIPNNKKDDKISVTKSNNDPLNEKKGENERKDLKKETKSINIDEMLSNPSSISNEWVDMNEDIDSMKIKINSKLDWDKELLDIHKKKINNGNRNDKHPHFKKFNKGQNLKMDAFDKLNKDYLNTHQARDVNLEKRNTNDIHSQNVNKTSISPSKISENISRVPRSSSLITSIIEIEKESILGLIGITSSSFLVNTAVLNGKQISQSMRVLMVTSSGTVSDVTHQCVCKSDDSIVKVSVSCTSLYLDGSEVRGGTTGIEIQYGDYIDTTYFTIYYPVIPLTFSISHSISTLSNWTNCPVYTPSLLTLYTKFIANKSGREILLSKGKHDVTPLVLGHIVSSDTSVLQVKGRVLYGKSEGIVKLNVLSPLGRGRVSGIKELGSYDVRVGGSEVSVLRLDVKVMTKLQMEVVGNMVKVKVEREFGYRYQEGVLDIEMVLNDSARIPLSIMPPNSYTLNIIGSPHVVIPSTIHNKIIALLPGKASVMISLFPSMGCGSIPLETSITINLLFKTNHLMNDATIQDKITNSPTPLEIGMYALLVVFTLAMISFVGSYLLFSSKKVPVVSNTPTNQQILANANDWVWLGKSTLESKSPMENPIIHANTFQSSNAPNRMSTISYPGSEISIRITANPMEEIITANPSSTPLSLESKEHLTSEKLKTDSSKRRIKEKYKTDTLDRPKPVPPRRLNSTIIIPSHKPPHIPPRLTKHRREPNVTVTQCSSPRPPLVPPHKSRKIEKNPHTNKKNQTSKGNRPLPEKSNGVTITSHPPIPRHANSKVHKVNHKSKNSTNESSNYTNNSNALISKPNDLKPNTKIDSEKPPPVPPHQRGINVDLNSWNNMNNERYNELIDYFDNLKESLA